jgi:hypothetical protein
MIGGTGACARATVFRETMMATASLDRRGTAQTDNVRSDMPDPRKRARQLVATAANAAGRMHKSALDDWLSSILR